MILALMAGSWSLAQDPAPGGDVFAEDDVQVEVEGSTWRITVRGRVLQVEVPKTADERALVEALVQSLLAELRLPAPAAEVVPAPPEGLVRPPPTEPSLAPAAEAVPPGGTHAEAVSRPEAPPSSAPRAVARSAAHRESHPTPAVQPASPWLLWGGGGLASRPQLAPTGGPVVGVQYGHRTGARLRAAWDLSRATRFEDDTRMGALRLDVAGWSAIGPAQLEVGAGVSQRVYRQSGQSVAQHLAPIATFGVGVIAEVGPWRVGPFLGGSVDLGVTDIELSGDDAVLSPVAAWLELRVGRRP